MTEIVSGPSPPIGLGAPLRITNETAKTLTVEWDPVPGAIGFLPLIDGKQVLADGKRHPSWDGSRTSTKFGRPQDNKPHEYTVAVLMPDFRSVNA